jgi:putative effector of murein hydrolase LrgA (UPF0299 family)
VTLHRAVTIALLAAAAVVGGLLALVTAFYVPTRAGVLSLGDALALVTIGPYAHAVGRAARSSAAAVVPAVAWLVTTMYFANLRTEGDIIVTGSVYGLLFLLLGTVSGAVGIGTVRRGVLRDDRRAAERAAAREEALARTVQAPPS